MSCIPWCIVSEILLIISPRSEGWEDLFQKERKIVTHAVEGAEILLITLQDSYLAPVVTKQPLPQYLLKITITKLFIWAFDDEPVLKKMERPQCQQVYQQKPETLKYWWIYESGGELLIGKYKLLWLQNRN